MLPDATDHGAGLGTEHLQRTHKPDFMAMVDIGIDRFHHAFLDAQIGKLLTAATDASGEPAVLGRERSEGCVEPSEIAALRARLAHELGRIPGPNGTGKRGAFHKRA